VTFGLNWLPETAYLFMLIFARVGTMLMLIPALGEQIIPARLRLSFALALTLAFYPLLSSQLPALPADTMGIIGILFHEIVVGLILGGIARLVVMATQVAGSVIAYQAGLSFAMSADPSQGGIQGAVIGSFLSFLGIALIFATDLHHVALSAIYDSYTVFPTTAPLMWDDALQMALGAFSRAFVIGVQMSAPFIVFGVVFYLGLGILSRLMPQLQVFFIAMPAGIGIGLLLMALLLVMMMGWYLMHFESELALLRGAR
jgi:flagellar biosynthetic protein FliR